MAASTLVDLVKVTTSTVGAGSTLQLSVAVAGFRSASGTLINGNTYSYAIQQGSNYEYGRGVYTSSTNRLTRGVIKSSNSNTPVSLLSGAQVAIVLLAEDLEDRVGIPAELTIGSVTSGPTPSVTISGVSPNFTLDFVLEPGATGDITPELEQLRTDVQADATQTALDRTQTGQDRTATGADRTAVAADKSAVHSDRQAADADAIATAADRTQTGQDRSAVTSLAAQVAADRTQTGQDVLATGYDLIEVNQVAQQVQLDGSVADANALQTAADRVQTALDRIATGQAVTDATAINRAASTALAVGTISPLIGTRIYASRAALDADLSVANGLYALVIGDVIPSYNDLYVKSGAPGVGTWGNPLGIFASASAIALQATADAVAAAAIAIAVVQAPSSVGRPVGTLPVTGSNISPAVYIYAIPLSVNVRAVSVRAYNNSGSPKNIRVGRMTLSAGTFTQVGTDTLISIPAGQATVTLVTPIDANAGEYIWVEPTSTAFTYTSGTNVGDNGGYYTLPSNSRSGAQGAVVTGTQLQFALDYNYVAVTGPNYLATVARVASLEAGPLTSAARPIEAIPTIYGIFGTVRIPNYLGPLVRLRRSTDSAESDFFAVSGGDKLDVAAITTWLNGATPFVKQVYSQKGSAYRCYQATPGLQPPLTISGTDSWVAFASGKWLDMISMTAFAQNKDGVTAGIIGQIPGTAGGDHNLLIFSAGAGVSRSRFGVLADNSNRLRTAATAWDEVSGYTGVGSEVAVSTGWWSAVSRASYRTGPAHMQVNGTDMLYTMTECVKSQNTASSNCRLNGYGADAGMTWNMHTLVLSDIAQSDVNAEALRQILITLTPGYSPPAAPSTIFPEGDSQVIGNTIVPGTIYQPLATYADRPGPVLANKYQTATGSYRPVKAKGASGANSTTIRTSFISTIVPLMTANDVLYIQVGQNDARSTPAERQVTIDNIALMIAASPTTKIIVGGLSYWRLETEVPLTQAWTDKKAVNDMIAAAFPTQYWAMQDMLKTYGGNTDGRTPDVLLWRANNGAYDAGHRGVLGTQVEYADGHSGQPGLFGVIVARGY